eukprot:gene9-9_t
MFLDDKRSPFYQHLPNCSANVVKRVRKKTAWKGIVCPMVKDEVGFLSEWVAFYELQGFDHVIVFDNNSTTSLDELTPWIQSGYVEIVRDWWKHEWRLFRNKKNKFTDMMRVKLLSEMQCKRRAVDMGYEVFVSLDLDEYLFPSSNKSTVMDELSTWFNQTTRGSLQFSKLQFNPVPHFLEPINLLTIEAFQVRYPIPDRMNYYSTVAPKVALRLQGGLDYNNDTIDFLVKCCDFHGCRGAHPGCKPLFDKGEKWKIEGKHKPWYQHGLHIHHYARSLEKYNVKQQSWQTAGSNREYDFFNFLDRTSGFVYDDSALSWTCQLRGLLRERTGEEHYLRPGDWYRNPEFGRTVEEPLKRGRYGAGYGKVLTSNEMNPYPPGNTYQAAHRAYNPSSSANSPPK